MATISISDLYIVVCYISHSGISGDTDNLYTDKAEAEKVAEMMSQPPAGHSTSIKHTVVTLDNYFDEVKRERYMDGRTRRLRDIERDY